MKDTYKCNDCNGIIEAVGDSKKKFCECGQAFVIDSGKGFRRNSNCELTSSKEYYYDFSDDDPGNLVEALNEDKSYIMWDIDKNNGCGIMIKIDYNGIHIKIQE